ncbi:MAG: cysteine hydrolase family protein [Candidatus Ranarchaeia archaeon]
MPVPYSKASDIEDILDPAQCALLVIDLQNDFCSPNGVLAKRGADMTAIVKMAPLLADFLMYCRSRQPKVKIIHIITHHSEWTNSKPWMRRYKGIASELRRICVPGTWGADIYERHDELRPQHNEAVIIKHRYSAFVNTDLDLILKAQQIRTLLVTGVSTNVCVESTARHGHMLDYHIVFLRDLTASTDADLYTSTLQNIQLNFGYVISSADLRERWERMLLR